MRQSRLMSGIEAVANVGVGYVVAVVTQLLVFPAFGIATTLVQNLTIGLIFTLVSLARSYTLRRAFEAILIRSGTTAKLETVLQPREAFVSAARGGATAV